MGLREVSWRSWAESESFPGCSWLSCPRAAPLWAWTSTVPRVTHSIHPFPAPSPPALLPAGYTPQLRRGKHLAVVLERGDCRELQRPPHKHGPQSLGPVPVASQGERGLCKCDDPVSIGCGYVPWNIHRSLANWGEGRCRNTGQVAEAEPGRARALLLALECRAGWTRARRQVLPWASTGSWTLTSCGPHGFLAEL